MGPEAQRIKSERLSAAASQPQSGVFAFMTGVGGEGGGGRELSSTYTVISGEKKSRPPNAVKQRRS